MEDFWGHPFAEHRGAALPTEIPPVAAAGGQGIFVELFAGHGPLTKAVSKVMGTEPPQDFGTGGVDFTDLLEVQRTLWSR